MFSITSTAGKGYSTLEITVELQKVNNKLTPCIRLTRTTHGRLSKVIRLFEKDILLLKEAIKEFSSL